MKRVAWLLTWAVLATLPSVLVPSIASAQYGGAQYGGAQYGGAHYGGPRSTSVIRPVGFGGGHGYQGGGPACDCGPAPLTCSGNCCVGYDNCCPHHCCLFDCFRKVVRALDCLLPCHSCGSGCCGGGCGGGCGHAHFFNKGCCDTCDVGCTTAAYPGSFHDGAPALSDPFRDDPVPPAPPTLPTIPSPMPDSQDAYHKSAPKSPLASRSVMATPTSRRMVASPYKVSNQPAARPQVRVQQLPAATRPSQAAPAQGRMANGGAIAKPAEQSVLRRASVEVEVFEQVATAEPIVADDAPAPPALLPVGLIARQSDDDIPVNPLRK